MRKRGLTQGQRARLIRDEYKALFPKLDELRRRLGKVLEDAQNPPEVGGARDGTISEVQYTQLRSIERATRHLLASLLFDSRE